MVLMYKAPPFFLLWLLLGFSPSYVLAEKLITADNPHIQYMGRVDLSKPGQAGVSWPATQIDTVISGGELGITLDDQYGKNYFNVFIDEDWHTPIVIACEQGRKTYWISRYLSAGKHRVTVSKRTEGEEGRTLFVGFNVSDQGKLFAPPKPPQRKIEFYGDSITSGMGNEAALYSGDADLAEKNSFMSYAAITGRKLKADYRLISQSGIGIMVSWFDFTMPQFYDQLDAVGDNKTAWDFSLWRPDVVVINLFQNDSWLVEKRLNPVPSDSERINAYKTFLTSVRQKYPNALIVATLGSMDATHKTSAWPGYIESAVASLKEEHHDNRIVTLFFPFEDYGQHPRVFHHQRNAERLSAFIAKKMRWAM